MQDNMDFRRQSLDCRSTTRVVWLSATWPWSSPRFVHKQHPHQEEVKTPPSVSLCSIRSHIIVIRLIWLLLSHSTAFRISYDTIIRQQLCLGIPLHQYEYRPVLWWHSCTATAWLQRLFRTKIPRLFLKSITNEDLTTAGIMITPLTGMPMVRKDFIFNRKGVIHLRNFRV